MMARAESPIDFPVSWDWHRHYSWYYGAPDPGPTESSKTASLRELKEELEALKKEVWGLSEEELRRFRLKGLYIRIDQLEKNVRQNSRLLAQMMRKWRGGGGKGKPGATTIEV